MKYMINVKIRPITPLNKDGFSYEIDTNKDSDTILNELKERLK